MVPKQRQELLDFLPQMFNFEYKKERQVPPVFNCPITGVDSTAADGRADNHQSREHLREDGNRGTRATQRERFSDRREDQAGQSRPKLGSEKLDPGISG